MKNQQLNEFLDYLERKASIEASCFPVDRYFLEPYMGKILSFNRNEFLLANLERGSNTYTVQLMLCLPECWEELSVDDIVYLVKKSTNIFSYYSLIEFTFKYVEVNIIELILNFDFLSFEAKKNIASYLSSSLYPNLIKTEADYLFFAEDVYGVTIDEWKYVKQRLLLDSRVSPACTTIEDLQEYVKIVPGLINI